MTFNPKAIEQFEYTGYNLDIQQGHLELHYALIGDNSSASFTEEISLPGGEYSPQVERVADRLARLLFLIAGISYYKAAVPPVVHSRVPITAAERDFLGAVIRNGLTEFAYVNNLPHALSPHITIEEILVDQPPVELSGASSQPLAPVGGGKDSIVTIEALRAAGYKPLLFSVNSYEPIQKTVDKSGLDYTQAGRKISPKLIEINQQGAYNGHVPVTAINSLIALMTAVLTGHKTVIFSNERSASAGNIEWEGIDVNHQWSKSADFEVLLQQLLRQTISADLQYFSLLRPFSELRIARQFAKLTQYHTVFTSCNRAFHLDEDKRRNWCGHCDKCRFVFLVLAPYLSKQALVAIFKKDMFDDGEQLAGFRQLLGIEGHKPLECVGEIVESRLALQQTAAKKEWQTSRLVPLLKADLAGAWPTEQQAQEVFAQGPHFVPDEYQAALNAVA